LKVLEINPIPAGWKKPEENLIKKTNKSNDAKLYDNVSKNIDKHKKKIPDDRSVLLFLLSKALPTAISVKSDIARPPPVINPI
jgi:hypothetical protein